MDFNYGFGLSAPQGLQRIHLACDQGSGGRLAVGALRKGDIERGTVPDSGPDDLPVVQAWDRMHTDTHSASHPPFPSGRITGISAVYGDEVHAGGTSGMIVLSYAPVLKSIR